MSYHHAADQFYYDEFSRIFSDTYSAVRDNSLERAFDSDNMEYVIRQIRENYITGTSCTLVLVGLSTWGRTFVDWEIKATLDRGHGLIGVGLPTLGNLGKSHAPQRLERNIDSGYARWVTWDNLLAGGPAFLRATVELAIAGPSIFLNNDDPLRERNWNP